MRAIVSGRSRAARRRHAPVQLRHITVAWGRDYADVTPLKGVAYGSGEHELEVAVDVQRIA